MVSHLSLVAHGLPDVCAAPLQVQAHVLSAAPAAAVPGAEGGEACRVRSLGGSGSLAVVAGKAAAARRRQQGWQQLTGWA